MEVKPVADGESGEPQLAMNLVGSVLNISALTDIVAEFQKAIEKHPQPMRSIHEGYAILLEEVDELWDEVKKSKPCMPCIRKEVIQVAAMALRFLVDLKPAAMNFSLTQAQVDEAVQLLGVDGGEFAAAYFEAMRTGKPVSIKKANGGTHHIMPAETGNFVSELKQPGIEVTRGPTDVDEQPHPGYSEFGG